MDADYFRTLFAYNCWANARILERSKEVSETEYFETFPGPSFGNLHGTLLHFIGGEMTWWRRFNGETAIPLTVAQGLDLASLFAVRDEAEALQREYFAKLTDADVNSDNTYGLPNGNMLTHKLGHQMGHWVNHATQFRSEAAVRLTALGLSPGGLDLAMWLLQRPAAS